MELTLSRATGRSSYTPGRGSQVGALLLILLSTALLGGCQLGGGVSSANCPPATTTRAADSSTPGARRWTLQTGNDEISSLVAAGGAVYLGYGEIHNDSSIFASHVTACYVLLAVDGRTGAKRWQISSSDPDGEYVGPTIANGVAYVGTMANVIALDARTGAQRWRTKLANKIYAPPLVANGIVYVSDGVYIFALDANTGGQMWRVNTNPAESLPWLANSLPLVANGALYVVSYGLGQPVSEVSAWNARTGAKLWQFTAPTAQDDDTAFPAAVANGMVYAPLEDGTLYALDARTGAKRWQAPISPGAEGFSKRLSVLDASNGVVFAGSRGGVYEALDAATGARRWRLTAPFPILAAQVVETGVIYVSAFDNSLGWVYALDQRTGAQRWSIPLTNHGLTVAGGVVYVSSPFFVTALDAKAGGQRWQFQVDTSDQNLADMGVPVIDAGGVYVAAYNFIFALNAR